MKCKHCGQEMEMQIINEVNIKKGHSLIWWLLVGWWYKPTMYFLFGVFYLLFVLIFKKQKAVNKLKKVYVCKNCGYTKKA